MDFQNIKIALSFMGFMLVLVGGKTWNERVLNQQINLFDSRI
jgi:hypothetical protein